MITSKYVNFKLEDKTKYVVLGHSHPACAFNDRLIKDLVNFSQAGEAYIYTYTKIKELSKNNPSLDTIFIEFGKNNILKVMDDWIYDDEHLMRLYKYIPYLEIDDIKTIFNNNPEGLSKALSRALRLNTLNSLLAFQIPIYYGGYTRPVRGD